MRAAYYNVSGLLLCIVCVHDVTVHTPALIVTVTDVVCCIPLIVVHDLSR